ncbi:MAG: hypothetical protein ACYTXI_41445 [Nostoc sp.]
MATVVGIYLRGLEFLVVHGAIVIENKGRFPQIAGLGICGIDLRLIFRGGRVRRCRRKAFLTDFTLAIALLTIALSWVLIVGFS